MRPKRLIRGRVRGWRKPQNAVIVDRTSKWGNPWRLIGDMIYCDASHRRGFLDKWVLWDEGSSLWDRHRGNQHCIMLYSLWVHGDLTEAEKKIVRPCPFTISDIKRELKGKDLICYCSHDSPCHADILLKIANES